MSRGSVAGRGAVLAGLVAGAVLLAGTSAQAAVVSQPVSFTADDGVVLHATIGAEAAIRKRPLIIEDSPYAPGIDPFAGPAYNYVQLQWRSTGPSGGTLSTNGARDQRDLSEFVAWACKHAWSNRRIGLYGLSAGAIGVYNTMPLPLPPVKAATPIAGTGDPHRD